MSVTSGRYTVTRAFLTKTGTCGMQDLAKQRHAGCCFLEAVDGRRFAQDNATLTLGRDEMELIAKLVGNPDLMLGDVVGDWFFLPPTRKIRRSAHICTVRIVPDTASFFAVFGKPDLEGVIRKDFSRLP